MFNPFVTMPLHAAADQRKDAETEEALETAIAIDRQMGSVAAFVFLRRLGVPAQTIVRVLSGGENARRPLLQDRRRAIWQDPERHNGPEQRDT